MLERRRKKLRRLIRKLGEKNVAKRGMAKRVKTAGIGLGVTGVNRTNELPLSI